MGTKLRIWMAAMASISATLASAGMEEGLSALKGGNVDKAMSEFTTLAEQGVPIAEYLLGMMHTGGVGAPKDPVKGMTWFVKAAEHGLPAAQANVADGHFVGIGAPRDTQIALKWYRRAAAQGWPPSQFGLASMYSSGNGVAADVVESYKWCLLSAHAMPSGKPRDKARERCDRILPRMSAAEIEEAKRRATEFVPTLEVTGDRAHAVFQACMRVEQDAARRSAAALPAAQAYSECGPLAESCRAAESPDCREGIQKYGVQLVEATK